VNTEAKVTVICLCYNHAPYVTESMQSVLDQTYKNYELLVVDDGSTDNSVTVIESFQKKHPQIKFIKQQKNLGICKAFNSAFKMSTGDFLIDLAADDILLPHRLESGVKTFEPLTKDVGVIFSDAEWIDERGQHLSFHSQKYPHQTIPQGDVYKDLIERYFICSPTMMFRREVLDALGGYDENLTYEDFDFWIRSSRIFQYHYVPEVLVKKRKLKNSLSEKQFKILNRHNYSTYRVCLKISSLNKTKDERDALARRLQYEMRQCIRVLDFSLAYKYFRLWAKGKS
jgi:GT2 family glycosyltransferase